MPHRIAEWEAREAWESWEFGAFSRWMTTIFMPDRSQMSIPLLLLLLLLLVLFGLLWLLGPHCSKSNLLSSTNDDCIPRNGHTKQIDGLALSPCVQPAIQLTIYRTDWNRRPRLPFAPILSCWPAPKSESMNELLDVIFEIGFAFIDCEKDIVEVVKQISEDRNSLLAQIDRNSLCWKGQWSIMLDRDVLGFFRRW